MAGVATIVSSVASDEALESAIRNCGAVALAAVADEDPVGKRFALAGMQLTLLKRVQPGDEHSRKTLGIWNFFKNRVHTKHERTREVVLRKILRSHLFIGVASAGGELDPGEWELLRLLCGELDGLILVERGLVDSSGRLVLGVDGGSDLPE